MNDLKDTRDVYFINPDIFTIAKQINKLSNKNRILGMGLLLTTASSVALYRVANKLVKDLVKENKELKKEIDILREESQKCDD